MADNSQVPIELYQEEEREMNYSTPCSSRSMSPHPGASCSSLSQEPIFTFNRNHQSELVGDVAVPVSVRQAVLF